LEQLERVRTPISGYAAHLSRTKQSFGGMGSLNDVAITFQGGYDISSLKSRGVNTKLRKLTTDLYSETSRLLSNLEPAEGRRALIISEISLSHSLIREPANSQ
jgi:hypothetical protein